MSNDRTTEILELVTDNFNGDNYRIKISTSDAQLIAQEEYSASQTDVEIIPAPGVGSRIVIHYGSIRTDSTSGEAYLHPDDDSFKMFQVYISNFASFTAGSLYIPLPENQAVKLTSTQGAKNIYTFLNYTIESI